MNDPTPMEISISDIDPGKPFFGPIVITPEIASHWLSYNIKNRPKVKRRTDALVTDIHNGDWIVNGETIKLGTDTEGNPWLIDGQHRLEGCIDSEASIISYVISGLDARVSPTIQETIDTGGKRTMSDALSLRGETDQTNLAAALRHVHRYLYHQDLRPAREPETIAVLMATLQDHPGLRNSIKAARTYTILGMPKSLIAALHYILGIVNPEERDDFFEKLHTGAMLSERDPILSLRNWLTRQVEFATNRPPTFMTAAVTIKAWNYWREGRLIQHLVWRPGGKKPERYPIADGLAEALARGGPEQVEEAA